MKNAFVNDFGVLTSFGYAASNNDDRRVEVAEDFDMPIGRTRLVGDKWLPHEPQPPVPASVSARQAQRALLEAGLLATIEEAITAMPSPQRERAEIDWRRATEFWRESELVLTLSSALGWSEAQVDELFRVAAKF